ncbi:MAG: hypothetical protein ACKORI_11325, partial [Verrucomicrobiota bacterium]
HGNLYGPRAADVAAHLGAGHDALLNVDVQGAATIRAKSAADPRLAAALVTVFVRVGDRDELRRRLTGRGTDAADEIERRVAAAEEELRHAGEYSHVIESGSAALLARMVAAPWTSTLSSASCPAPRWAATSAARGP